MMDQLIKKFPAQLKEGLEIGESTFIRPHHFQIQKIVMTGMGGSGIGGAYVADLIADECPCPYLIMAHSALRALMSQCPDLLEHRWRHCRQSAKQIAVQ